MNEFDDSINGRQRQSSAMGQCCSSEPSAPPPAPPPAPPEHQKPEPWGLVCEVDGEEVHLRASPDDIVQTLFPKLLQQCTSELVADDLASVSFADSTLVPSQVLQAAGICDNARLVAVINHPTAAEVREEQRLRDQQAVKERIEAMYPTLTKARESDEATRTAWRHCWQDAKEFPLATTDPIRLGLAREFATLVSESDKGEAVRVATEAFEDAIGDLDTLSEENFQETVSIMQGLRDDLVAWSGEGSGVLVASAMLD